MLTDIVVDTNVFMHADNPIEVRHADAATFVLQLVESTVALCVDEGFDLDEARNRSLIGAEYLRRLTPLSLGFRAVAALIADGRVKLVDRKVEERARKQINRLVSNKRDRTFVRVTHQSDDRTLCSHDYRDFPDSVRGRLKAVLDIVVCDAGAACRLF